MLDGMYAVAKDFTVGGAYYHFGDNTPGTARTEFLFVSGDDGKSSSKTNAFYALGGEHGYYDNEMVILGRDKNAYTTDNSIICNAGNKDQGQIGGYLGYDLPVTGEPVPRTDWNS